MTSNCDNLDAYLADDLPAGAAAQFAQHLDQCELCRDAVEQQRWIDSLLSSDACATLEPLPAALHETLRASIARRRQTARLIACSVVSLSKGGLAAAAAVAIVAAGWTLRLNRQASNVPGQKTNPIAKTGDPGTSAANHSAAPRATFVSNGDTIAVPLESTDDNVTIVQLYPTTETERRTRREMAFQFTKFEPNGG